MSLRLSKHEGAGNDFLVLVDADDRVRLSVAEVRVLCDRHRGVGADGLLRVGPGKGGRSLADRLPADLWMELRNADGSLAEMSGNGIRCLAQAAVDGGLVDPPRFTVATAAGIRTIDYRPSDRPAEAWAAVDMGPVRLGAEEPADPSGRRGRRVDVGNPHLVLVGPDDPDDREVASAGPRLEAATPGGVNVEFITVAGPDRLRLRVWERGVGETLACGTGSCAAAAAARAWGLVGDRVRVDNPGGTLEVRLAAAGTAVLAGPTRRVADVLVDPAFLAAARLDGAPLDGARSTAPASVPGLPSPHDRLRMTASA